MAFHEDLQYGEEIERIVINKLESIGHTFKKNPDKMGVDLVGEGRNDGDTIEVKHDIMYKKTKNIALEYRFRGKPSGVSKVYTYFLVVLDEPFHTFYVAKENELKEWLRLNWRNIRKVNGGDNRDSSIILLKKDQFLKTFRRL